MSDIYFYPRGLVEGRDKYFKLDILDFVSKVLEYQVDHGHFLKFKDFNQVWKKNDINLIHHFRQENESESEYYDILYFTILSMLIQSDQHKERVVLFYLLYAVYMSSNKRCLISFDQNTVDQLYFFLRDCKDKFEHDVPILMKILIDQKAILLSTRIGSKNLAIHPCGLPYTVTKRDKQILKDIIEDNQDDIKNKSLSKYLKASEDYHEYKQKHQTEMNQTDSHLISRSIHTLNNIFRS